MSDAATDSADTTRNGYYGDGENNNERSRNMRPLDDRIIIVRSNYYDQLHQYLVLVKNTKDKRKRALSEKLVMVLVAKWDDLAGGTNKKWLSKNLKLLVKNDRTAWASLLCSIDSETTLYIFVRLSPFSIYGVNIIQCNGNSIKLLQGNLKDTLEKALPDRSKSMSRFLVIITPSVSAFNIDLFPGD